MLKKLLKPHVVFGLGILFAVAWGIWTFLLLPESETPRVPPTPPAESGVKGPN